MEKMEKVVEKVDFKGGGDTCCWILRWWGLQRALKISANSIKRHIGCAHPMIIDFVSMYPSIMSSSLISPESIDYCEKDYRKSRGLRIARV